MTRHRLSIVANILVRLLRRRSLGLGVALLIFTVAPDVAAYSARSAGVSGRSHAVVLRTVTPVELSRFYVRLRPLPAGFPLVARKVALHTADVLTKGQKALEAVPALVAQAGREPKWLPDWVISLKPYPGLRSVPLWPGHPRLNKAVNRRPFLLMFVSARTGRYQGETFEYWRGHFVVEPCMQDLGIHPQAFILLRGKWEHVHTVSEADTGSTDPVIPLGQVIRLSLSVSPSVCFDRFSRVHLYFRRAYAAKNGVIQFRNGVGPSIWMSGTRAKNSWSFNWKTRFRMNPKSGLLLAVWDIGTGLTARVSPDLLLHIRSRR